MPVQVDYTYRLIISVDNEETVRAISSEQERSWSETRVIPNEWDIENTSEYGNASYIEISHDEPFDRAIVDAVAKKIEILDNAFTVMKEK